MLLQALLYSFHFSFGGNFVFAQTIVQESDNRGREAGVPFITTFDAKVYGGDQQNWDIIQDERGIMYVANQFCLLEYDAVEWRQIYPGSKMSVRSLAKDSSGRIWLGAAKDFGYLAADSTGSLQLQSQLELLPEELRVTEQRWSVAVTSEDIYFYTENLILRWSDNAEIVAIQYPVGGIDKAFVIADQLYLRQPGLGLHRLEGDSLVSIPGGEQFADIKALFVLPHPQSNVNPATKQFLVGTPRNGLFEYDGVNFRRFQTEADAYLAENDLICGVVLPNGDFVFGTRHGGIVSTDHLGELLLIRNKENGLPNNTVYNLYSDREGGLWLALNKGLAKIELNSPLTGYDMTPSLKSGVTGMVRHRGKLYVSTAEGVFWLEPGQSGALPKFMPVEGKENLCGVLLSVESQLFVVSVSGLYVIEDYRARMFYPRDKVHILWVYRSRFDSSRVYLGLRGGLAWMQKIDGKWTFSDPIPRISEIVEGIAEESANVLWLTTRYGTATRVSAPFARKPFHADSGEIVIEKFNETHGLGKSWVEGTLIRDKLLFVTHNGLRRFDQDSRTFLPEPIFNGLFTDSSRVLSGKFFDLDNRGRLWTARSGSEIGMAAIGEDGKYKWNPEPFHRIEDFGEVWIFYIDEKVPGVYWFGGADGVMRYDDSIAKNYSTRYPALIRRLIVNGDSILYDGAEIDGSDGIKSLTLSYEDNTIRLDFAAPYFDKNESNEYQFFLEGFDSDWSHWTHETMVDYRQLPEGRYTFHVRARNVYKQDGQETQFRFEIQPPWYRSWWSYMLYACLLLGFFYFLRRYEMSRQRFKYQAELEKVESEKLKELDTIKSDFFANISHEFRTPLTLILGPAEQLVEENNGSVQKKANLIRRNAQRLLQLTNQIQDLSKLESGGLPLKVRQGDFVAFLKGLTMSFESLAANKQIDLRFDSNNPQSVNYFDQDKIEKIFSNLLSNALKFTQQGGIIEVLVAPVNCRPKSNTVKNMQRKDTSSAGCAVCLNGHSVDRERMNMERAQCVEVTIRDTGEGISSISLPYIFDRFYQANSSSRRIHGGTGIGLALAKELIELHYGSIVVESTEGVGSAFKIILPLGKGHLKHEQFAEVLPKKVTKLADNANKNIRLQERQSSSANNGELERQNARFNKNGSSPQILIVEDNHDVRAYIREQLEKNYGILEAEDGRAGLELALKAMPDLIISDVMMPKMDGYALCRNLKSDPRTSHIPIVLLTAKAGDEETVAGFETGADAYVLKPFRHKELVLQVRNMIQVRQAMRRRFRSVTIIKPDEVATNSVDLGFLEQVVAAIEANIDKEQYNVEALAGQVALSVSQLNRKLKALTGQPAGQMLRRMRLQRGAELLIEKTDRTVAEVCYAVGFSDQANFTRSFKKLFGSSPSEYRKSRKTS
ncbi:MAG: response regulator [Calditrichia bacterium]